MEPFFGVHQAGILTRQQACTSFAVFDLKAADRNSVVSLLQRWTTAAANMTSGLPADSLDSGENEGMPAARLTLTFGLGAGLFVKEGKDRYGLQSRRPALLVDLPPFPGDELDPARTGGDLSIQACADDRQTVFHAIRQLVRLSADTAQLRWMQGGFLPDVNGQTPRNLLGFKDGTQNLNPADPFVLDAHVWSGVEGPAWMRNGTYLVVRRIRLALDRWDALSPGEQEQIIGRRKTSGAPLGGEREHDPERFAAEPGGKQVIPDTAHIRLASFEGSKARILRRGYSYHDGLLPKAEMESGQAPTFDAGLLFMAYQKDPRTGFVRMFETLSRSDRLAAFATHTGSGVFAIPPGVVNGNHIAGALFS